MTDVVSRNHGVVHEPLLDVAGGCPVLTYVDYHGFGHFLPASAGTSVQAQQNRHGGEGDFLKKYVG
jgi:hypothetical protein